MTPTGTHASTVRGGHSLAGRLVASVGLPSLFAMLYVVAHLAWLLLQPAGASWAILVSDAFFIPPFLATGVWAWRASGEYGRLAKVEPADAEASQFVGAWRLLAVAYLILFLANVVWAGFDAVAPGGATPAPVRWLTLVSYVPLVVGLMRFPMRERGPRLRVRMALDQMTVAAGAGLVIWYVVLRPLAASSDWRSVLGLLQFIPPLGDLAVVTVVASLLLQRTRDGVRTWLSLLAFGHLLSVGAGIAAGYVALDGVFQPGGPIDAAWMLSDLFVFFGIELARRNALAAQARRRDETAELAVPSGAWQSAPVDVASSVPSRISLWLPYAFVAIAFTVLVETAGSDASSGVNVALVGNLVVLLLVGARQVAAFRENARLAVAAVRQESRFHALVQYASDVVTVIDVGGVVLYQSPAVTRLVGYEPAELIGRPLAQLLHPAESERFDRHLRDMAESGRTSGAEWRGRPTVWRLRHRDGRWISVETLGTALLDDPAVQGIVLNTRDVTERLHLEEQLRGAQKLEAVGRLAAGIAHDFNNLLTVVRCNASLVRQEWRAPAEAGRELDEIEGAVDRATALIRQLLAFSRQEIVQPVTLDVGALVRALAPLIDRLIGSSITLDVTADAATWVRADAGQLEQVVMNLAVNARDAMPDGGRLSIVVDDVDIEARPTPGESAPAPGRYVRLLVSDTGHGMSEETRAHLFDPFFTTKPSGQGTGLGLSTVFGIVTQGGGHVGVTSAPNAGATFRVHLPRVEAPASEPVAAEVTPVPTVDGPAAPASEVRSGLQRSRRGETVLVADDEDAVRAALRRLLDRCGYTVLVARDGVEALEVEAAHVGPIDLLLTDMVMPRLGGRELADEFVRRRPSARVICMSGYTDDETLRSGMLAQESAFLGKPFSVVAAAALVHEVLAPTATV